MDQIDIPLNSRVCIDINALYENSQHPIGSTSVEDRELSLIIHLDKEVTGFSDRRPLDLTNVDFAGTTNVAKQLFALPYHDKQPLFAFHRMGNTLLLDTVTGSGSNNNQNQKYTDQEYEGGSDPTESNSSR